MTDDQLFVILCYVIIIIGLSIAVFMKDDEDDDEHSR
jgi:hypothetical protein